MLPQLLKSFVIVASRRTLAISGVQPMMQNSGTFAILEFCIRDCMSYRENLGRLSNGDQGYSYLTNDRC